MRARVVVTIPNNPYDIYRECFKKARSPEGVTEHSPVRKRWVFLCKQLKRIDTPKPAGEEPEG